jgi:dipeptidyl aminopeptidase/acylaminoacyl peptidase
MRASVRGRAAALCVIGLSLSIPAAAGANDESKARSWTPEDSVALRYISSDVSDPWKRPFAGRPGEIVPSPDARWFFFITHHGDLPTDAEVYELHVFEVAEVRRALASKGGSREGTLPVHQTLVFRSFDSIYPGLADVRWQPDSRALLFKGVAPDGVLQAFRFEVESSELRQLTRAPRDVLWFEYEKGTTVFGSRAPYTRDRPFRYPFDVLVRDAGGVLSLASAEASTLRKGSEQYSVAGADGKVRAIGSVYVQSASISPDARKAILVGFRESDTNRSRRRSYFLVDLGREIILPTVEIPLAPRGARKSNPFAPEVVWSDDSSRVVLINATAPDGVVDAAGAGAVSTAGVELQADTGTWRLIDSVESASAASRAETGRTAAPKLSDTRAAWGFELNIRQGANEPPIIIASRGQREVPLMGPDPALANIWRARMEPFHWREEDGTERTSGLLLPRDFKKGHPIPLVIQNYEYVPEFFLPDGTHPHSDASQALVAQGFAVVQINATRDLSSRQMQEGPGVVRQIDAIVAALARAGIIDPSRVGLTGFSRAGFECYYAITHPGRMRLAAAVCADGFTGDFPLYLQAAALGAPTNSFEDLRGGSFWNRKAEWLEQANSFHVDKVDTPVLFSETLLGRAPTRGFSYGALTTIGAFRLNKKPIEYLSFPEAAHDLRRPRERFEMMRAVIDWMNFWLKDELPTDPDRAMRWPAMRAEWEASRRSNKVSDGSVTAPAPSLGRS